MIYSLVKTSLRKLTFSILLSILAGSLYALSVKFLHQILTNEPDAMGLFLRLLACILASTFLSVYSGHFLTKTFENQVSDLRLSLSERILNSNFYHVEQNSLRIIPVLNNDINTIGSFMKTVPDFFVSISKILACLGYMFWLSWQLSTYVLAIYAVIFLLTFLIFPRIHKEEKFIRELKNDIFEQVNGLVRGLKELTLNKKHKSIYVQEMMGPISRLHSESLTRLATLNLVVTKLGELVVIVALAFIIINFNQTNLLNDGLLLEFLTVVLFILPSLIIVTKFFNTFKKVEVALGQINQLGLEHEANAPAKDQPLTAGEPAEPVIELSDIDFVYGTDKEGEGYHIGPFNFTINKGEIVYLSGGNGSGKTTLGKILVGLYTPVRGTLKYKGEAITYNTLNEYRNRFSALFPDSHVFRSLKYIDDDNVARRGDYLIDMLKIGDIVNIRDKTLSTIKLSQGQQGRLSLLRSLLEDKEIYLFDEWAANQDPLFKSKFYSEIVPLLKKEGKTVIVITHDESYFHMADRIIKLQDGHVVAITDGAHVSL